MAMRSAAAVLLLTLLGPSILSMVCDVTCVHHEHHAARAAAEQSCHEQRGWHHGLAMSGATAASCHDQAENVTATAADVRIQKAAPVAVQVPSALAVYHPQLSLVARSTSFNPAGIVLQTTPLRI